jgi:hypothetical protein
MAEQNLLQNNAVPGKPIKFRDWNCMIRIEKYVNSSDDRKALLLVDHETEEEIAVMTINVPEERLEDDEVIIKNYSENEGILDMLIDACIISWPLRLTKKGRFPICKLYI